MTHQPGAPEDWDRLREALPPDLAPPPAPPHVQADTSPGRLLLLAGALGDLVSVVVVCATALVALRALGHLAGLPVLPWIFALSLAWWSLSATTLVVVRRGTPGMLLAGFSFASPVAHRRVAGVLLVALLLATTLGVAALLGLPGPLLRLAGGSGLVLVEPE